MKEITTVLGIGAIVMALVGVGVTVLPRERPPAQRRATRASRDVTWRLAEGNVWAPTDSPPPCPDSLVFRPPVDVARVTSVLYPGQPRGHAFKPHGGFRFDGQSNREVAIEVPLDALVVRGSRDVRTSEPQYAFEFLAPCGILYSFGHLRTLSPEFQAIIDRLPPPDLRSPFSTLADPVPVQAGETIATAVGYATEANIFVDWGVFDLRHTNGATLRPAWAAYREEFDVYAVCWLDLLPPNDAARLKRLPGGDHEHGKESDYCRAEE